MVAIIVDLGSEGLTVLARGCDSGAWIGTNIFAHPEVGCNPVPYGY